MKRIGKIKVNEGKFLSFNSFLIYQALIVSKFEYERLFKSFIENESAMIVDDELEEFIIGTEEWYEEGDVNPLEINYKLNSDYFLFYIYDPKSMLEMLNTNNFNLDSFERLMELLTIINIPYGSITTKLINIYKGNK